VNSYPNAYPHMRRFQRFEDMVMEELANQEQARLEASSVEDDHPLLKWVWSFESTCVGMMMFVYEFWQNVMHCSLDELICQ
jgi:hypothetical protein